MKKTKITIKTTSLALALALALPVHAFATEPQEDQAETPKNETVLNEEDLTETKTDENAGDPNKTPVVSEGQSLDQAQAPYTTNVTMSLSEDGTKANYELTITANTENPTAISGFVYIPEVSNIENIKLIGEDKIITSQKNGDLESLGFATDGPTTLKFTADIKEGKKDRLFFDLALIDSEQNFKETQRLVGSIDTDDADNAVLNKLPLNEDLVSSLKGQFIDENTIQWTDYLINTTAGSLKAPYSLNLSENHTVDSKVSFEILELTSKGYQVAKTGEVNEDELQNIDIAPHALAKISFVTTANPEDDLFTINQINVTRPVHENSEEKDDQAPDTLNSAEEFQEKLDENTDKFIEVIEKVQKQIEENEAKQTPEKTETSEKEKAQPVPVVQIDKNDEQDIIDELKDNEEKIADAIEQAGEDNKNTDAPDSKEVKTVVLAERDDENTEKLIKLEGLGEISVDDLMEQMRATNQEINSILDKANGRASTVMRVSKSDPSKETLAAPLAAESDSEKVQSLIAELEDRSIEIEKLITRALDNSKAVYDKVLEISPELKEKEQSTEEADLAEAQKIQAQLDQIIAQVDLSLELDKLEKNAEDQAKVKAIIQNLEELAANSKEVVDATKESTGAKEVTDFARIEIKPLVDGYSANVSEKVDQAIKKVKTVTLDPLKEIEVTEAKTDIASKYPSLGRYIKQLEERSKLVNPSI